MFAEHNVAFQINDHSIPLLKKIIDDSEVIKNVQMHRFKCTNIITKILAPVEVEGIVEAIRKTPFSILVDESTDITVNTFLCLLVKYVDQNSGMLHTRLLELISLDATDCTANSIFNQFKKSLDNNQIPITNIIGIASDGTNVMTGKNNSFVSRLKSEVPDVIFLKCICHSLALVASKTCKKLPRSTEELIRSISTYVFGSAKRSAQLVEIQDFFDEKRKKNT